MDKDDKKIYDFIDTLKGRTIHRIDNSDIKESCTATLLLIFAALDSLSKITCSEQEFEAFKRRERGENRARFTGFLDKVMGDKYTKFKCEIYELRNDIVHTGINQKTILSKSSHDNRHLEEVNGALWINTKQFLDDFKLAVEQICTNIQNKGAYYQNAMERINAFKIIEIDERQDMPTPGADDEIF